MAATDDHDLATGGGIPLDDYSGDVERIREVAHYELELPADLSDRVKTATEGMLVDPALLEEAITALAVGHLVLQGPPGTGKELGSSFERLGCTPRGPNPLHTAKSAPVYTIETGGAPVELWFQRTLFSGERRWRYSGGGELYGIYDVVARREDRPPLIVDAKFRWATGETRPEETFKMLGYADNQRLAAHGVPFHGLLLFPGAGSSHRWLTADDGSRLDVIVWSLDAEPCVARAAVDAAVRAWLI